DRIASLLTLVAARRPARWLYRRHPRGMLQAPLAVGGYLGSERVRTPDRRVQLAPPEFVNAAELLDAFADRELADSSLRLISRRERHSHNSWTHNAEPFVSTARSTNRLHVNPDDATKLGLADGDAAVVTSVTGSLV